MFNDGNIVNITDDINEELKVEGFPTTCSGITFDELVDADPIDDGVIDDKVETAGFPCPQCGNTYSADQDSKVDDKVKTSRIPHSCCGKIVFPNINDSIR